MPSRRFWVFVSLFCAAPLAAAAETFRFGVLPMVAGYDVYDPNGPTEQRAAFSIAGVILVDMGRDSRLVGQLVHDSFQLSASTTNIAQDVSSTGANVEYQMMFRVMRGWKPWIGLGAGYASESYSNRYTVTPGGFKGASYPDRTKDDFTVVVNTSTEWQLNRDWDMGVHLQFEQPTGSDGTRVIRFGIYAVY